jgi:hypothetical protein
MSRRTNREKSRKRNIHKEKTPLMSYLLQTLAAKKEVDQAILNTDDLLLVLRFGRTNDPTCLQLDEIVPPWLFNFIFISIILAIFKYGLWLQLSKTERELSKMAVIRLVDVDAVPEYVKYFDITLIPATIFFFNAQHMKCDYGYETSKSTRPCFLVRPCAPCSFSPSPCWLAAVHRTTQNGLGRFTRSRTLSIWWRCSTARLFMASS